MIASLFEEHLLNNLPTISDSDFFQADYQNALRQMLGSGGKRFRPHLLLWTVDFYQPLLTKNALDVALALEFLHTYSLIHDDLPCMDDATLRRGIQTLHITYNEAVATLVGDALNTEAFYLIAKAHLSPDVKIKLVELLAQNGGQSGMVLGQYIDLEYEDKSLSLEQLETLHLNKTAKLIACALKMGGVIANLPEAISDKLFALGIEIGILFQIQDDILDVVKSQGQIGKNTEQDKDKNSFVNLLTLEGAYQKADERVIEIREILQSNFDRSFENYFIDKIEGYLMRHRA